jgi:hypothetical protein
MATNLALLVIAVIVADHWSYTQWQWWAFGGVLGAFSLILAWRTIPAQLRSQFAAQLVPILHRAT